MGRTVRTTLRSAVGGSFSSCSLVCCCSDDHGRSDPQTTIPEQIQFVLSGKVGTIFVTVMCGNGFQGISTEAEDTN